MITFDDIQRANAQIRTMDIKGKASRGKHTPKSISASRRSACCFLKVSSGLRSSTSGMVFA